VYQSIETSSEGMKKQNKKALYYTGEAPNLEVNPVSMKIHLDGTVFC
jgi:hypothetical protein